MNREQKQEIIAKWHERFGKARGIVLTTFQGLNAEEMFKLRKSCNEAGTQYVVLKNTLARLALKDTPFEKLSEDLRGPIGWLVGYDEEVTAAKVAAAYAKENDKFHIIKGGIENQVLSEDEVKQLATMPGKDEMRAQFLSVLQAVPSKFVATLNEIPSGLARVLDAFKSAKENA